MSPVGCASSLADEGSARRPLSIGPMVGIPRPRRNLVGACDRDVQGGPVPLSGQARRAGPPPSHVTFPSVSRLNLACLLVRALPAEPPRRAPRTVTCGCQLQLRRVCRYSSSRPRVVRFTWWCPQPDGRLPQRQHRIWSDRPVRRS